VGEHLRQPVAPRVAEHVDAVESERVEQRHGVRGQSRDAHRQPGKLGAAGARGVERNEPVTGQPAREWIPDADVRAVISSSGTPSPSWVATRMPSPQARTSAVIT
jgi:hypothetical protein